MGVLHVQQRSQISDRSLLGDVDGTDGAVYSGDGQAMTG